MLTYKYGIVVFKRVSEIAISDYGYTTPPGVTHVHLYGVSERDLFRSFGIETDIYIYKSKDWQLWRFVVTYFNI